MNRALFLLCAACLSSAIFGCRRDLTSNGPLSIPPANTIRLIPGIHGVETPDRANWTWSILGERNWTAPSANGARATLGDSYPLNDVKRQHGCNTWNCDLTVIRDRARTEQADWTLTLHGSNGMTARSAGAVPLNGGDVAGVTRIEADRASTVDLPATFVLAHLGGTDITLKIEK